jgi:hypothetical protein
VAGLYKAAAETGADGLLADIFFENIFGQVLFGLNHAFIIRRGEQKLKTVMMGGPSIDK